MKTEKEIENVYNVLDSQANRFSGMTYEQGWEEALIWVLDIDNDVEPPIKE